MAIDANLVRDRLEELVSNVWWSWQPEVWELFASIDAALWHDGVNHHPGAFLNRVEDLEGKCDATTLDRIERLIDRRREYLEHAGPRANMEAGPLHAAPVAYFCAEFGLHESLRIYSGGLGILAGDHMKAASDLAVPLVGIGLFYHVGYFQQSLDESGWQQERYDRAVAEEMPMRLVHGDDDTPLHISVESGEGELHAQIWEMKVGRNSLFLLDANISRNNDEDRTLTAKLYGGDRRMRIRQELLLGVGGVRALQAMGIDPGVYHLNEGHSAFAPLELCHYHMAVEGLTFKEARARVARKTVFTTHTPVPAGHDRFELDLFEATMAPLRERLGLSHREFHDLGRVRSGDMSETFCMTVLAIKMSDFRNGVSNLHGRVSRHMWHGLYPTRPVADVPIGHITNGVHVGSFLSPEWRTLYSQQLATGWEHALDARETWEPLLQTPPEKVWEIHQTLKRKLLDFIAHRANRSLVGKGDGQIRPGSGFEEGVLTIGFARRFATYKRANLILQQLDRFKAMIVDSERPIQLVFSGKAHPHDEGGKALIREIVEVSTDPAFKGRVVFLEDYDMNIARHMLQGVDVWLNNPRRPLEACGTSGQKVIFSGALNCSILDGWWAEAYDGRNGFSIGNGEEFKRFEEQDAHDVEALYEVLENEVIPLYYQRDAGSALPVAWIERMLWAMASLGWRFNADRMVLDYMRNAYLPAAGATCAERK